MFQLFTCSPEQGDTSDVNILYGISHCNALLGHSLLKGVQVTYDKVNEAISLSTHICFIRRTVTCQNATSNSWVYGLYTTSCRRM